MVQKIVFCWPTWSQSGHSDGAITSVLSGRFAESSIANRSGEGPQSWSGLPCLNQCHPEAEEFELALMGFLLLSGWMMPAWGLVAIMAIGGTMIGP